MSNLGGVAERIMLSDERIQRAIDAVGAVEAVRMAERRALSQARRSVELDDLVARIGEERDALREENRRLRKVVRLAGSYAHDDCDDGPEACPGCALHEALLLGGGDDE